MRCAAVRIVGGTELLGVLLRRIAPVVRLLLRRLLVRTGSVARGISGRRVLLMPAGPVPRLRWRRVPGVVRHVAAVLFLE